MKRFAIFNLLVCASIVTATLSQYAILGAFEKQLGTPIIERPGEEPFAYDTDIMPLVPCCSSVFYLVIVNATYLVYMSVETRNSQSIPARRWWFVVCVICAIPFIVPLLTLASAVLLTPKIEPIYIHPDG